MTGITASSDIDIDRCGELVLEILPQLRGSRESVVHVTTTMGAEETTALVRRFPAASATKTMVALTIARLAELGVLALEDPIGIYLPGVGTPETTIAKTMGHRAGFPSDIADDVWTSQRFPSRDELDEFVRTAGTVRRIDAFLYSNVGYAVLGRVAEIATEQSWTSLVDELVLSPLGMWHTSPQPPRNGPGSLGSHLELRALGPCGQMWSTTLDLCRLAVALRTGAKAIGISDELLRSISDPWSPMGRSGTQAYGMGAITYTFERNPFIGVHGVISSTECVALSTEHLSVALAVERGKVEELARAAATILTEVERKLGPTVA